MKSSTIGVLLVSLVLFACSSNEDNSTTGDHVWKEQTATIDKAKEVEAMMLKSAQDKARKIDEKTQ